MEDQWVPHERSTWPWRIGRLKKSVNAQEYLGYWENQQPAMREIFLPEGSLVKIVMVSRFGDVGITPNIQADHGYVARVPLEDLEREEP